MVFIETSNGTILNVDDITVVTKLFGYPNWIRYAIIMKNGKEYYFYEKRSADPSYMPREKFLNKLKKYVTIETI